MGMFEVKLILSMHRFGVRSQAGVQSPAGSQCYFILEKSMVSHLKAPSTLTDYKFAVKVELKVTAHQIAIHRPGLWVDCIIIVAKHLHVTV